MTFYGHFAIASYVHKWPYLGVKRALRFFKFLTIGIGGLVVFAVVVTWLQIDLERIFESVPFLENMFKVIPLVVIGTCWAMSGTGVEKEEPSREYDPEEY